MNGVNKVQPTQTEEQHEANIYKWMESSTKYEENNYQQ